MKNVFVVGAGPAGLFAAQKLALAGHHVAIFNRDIKPGGLAEYGIYPTKDKMKSGLRKQFAKALGLPNVKYFGHVGVGRQGSASLEDLRDLGPAAMVFSVGAQGTKKLGLPGEDAAGVYSAKDFVYHYNRLPPFATRDFSMGRRIAIVGMGNVMVDIARWLLLDDPEDRPGEIIVVARRGPFEAKFDAKEFAHIEQFLDRRALQEELARIRERLAAVGQDIGKVAEERFPVLAKPPLAGAQPRLSFRFLASPQAIHAGGSGRMERLTVSENALVEREGAIVAKATGQATDLEVDTMIFAIGDVVDTNLGLPCGPQGYVTNPGDPTGAAYEVYDPQAGKVLEGIYVAGWARKASTGLVGIARHDGEQGAARVLQYLETVPEQPPISEQAILGQIQRRGRPAVTTSDLAYLANAEAEMAKAAGVEYFKFADDSSMLAAIEKEKSAAPLSST